MAHANTRGDKKCSTALKIHGVARRGAARSVRARLASSDTIRGELLFVQRSALNASRSEARKAVNGYADSKTPKSDYRKSRGASRGLEFGNNGRAFKTMSLLVSSWSSTCVVRDGKVTLAHQGSSLSRHTVRPNRLHHQMDRATDR